jgi:hypothetical protein
MISKAILQDIAFAAIGPIRFSYISGLLSLCTSLGAATALGQGKVEFDTFVKGSLITHVYLPSPANPGLVQIGNGTSDYPVGTTDWSGWAPVSGDGFSAQLFAAPGTNAPINSLTPAFPVTTFHTGVGAGFVNAVVAPLSGVFPGDLATVQMRVWDNKSGTVNDWGTAVAQPSGTERLGLSLPFEVGPVGGAGGSSPLMIGLQSFNLAYSVPESSVLTLTGAGGLLLCLACRRTPRKNAAPDRR